MGDAQMRFTRRAKCEAIKGAAVGVAAGQCMAVWLVGDPERVFSITLGIVAFVVYMIANVVGMWS